MKRPLTFPELVALEPRLQEAENLARLHAGKDSDRLWFHVIKPAFKFLVGFMSRNPDKRLRDTGTYRTVYRHLLDIYSGGVDEG